MPKTSSPDQAALRSSLLVGFSAMLLVLLWQFLQVHYLHQDNWTSLYYTGELWTHPPELAQENIYRFPGIVGYDGQQYHIMAHDPLFQRGFAQYVDIPRLRYRRIFVSGLAAFLSFGHDEWVDPIFGGLLLLAVFLGAYWLSRWTGSQGRSPWWGWLFLLMPATIASFTFLVVDVALAALVMGVIWYAHQDSRAKLFAVLACLLLTRESGLVVLAGCCLWFLVSRQYRQMLLYSLAALPLAGWMLYVQQHTGPIGDAPHPALNPLPFYGIGYAFFHPYVYEAGLQSTVLTLLDRLGLVSVLVAIWFVARAVKERTGWSLLTSIALVHAAAILFLHGGDFWSEVIAYGRVFTPLFLILCMWGIVSKNRWLFLPLLLILPRIGIVQIVHLGQVVRAAVN